MSLRPGSLDRLRKMARRIALVAKQLAGVVVVPTTWASPIPRLPCHRWAPSELALLPVPIVMVATLKAEPVTLVPVLLQFLPDATMCAEEPTARI